MKQIFLSALVTILISCGAILVSSMIRIEKLEAKSTYSDERFDSIEIKLDKIIWLLVEKK